MKCEKCGAEVGTGHIACMKCGALLPLTNNDNYGLNWDSNISFDSNYNKPEPVVEEKVEESEPEPVVEEKVEESEPEPVVEEKVEESEPEVQEEPAKIIWEPVETEQNEEKKEKKKEESGQKSASSDSKKTETKQSKRLRDFAAKIQKATKDITASTEGKTISGCIEKIKTDYKARTEKNNNNDLIWASIVDISKILLGLFVFKVFVPVVKALAIFFDSDTYRKIKKKYKEIINDDKKFAKALIIFVVGLIVIILLISKIAIWLN